MNKVLLCLIFFILPAEFLPAQDLSSVDSTKYRINLPDFWKPGNKIWRILTDKLPIVCEELKDKEICGDDCNPWLRIEFEMSQPVIFDHLPNHISANYTHTQRVSPYDIWDIQTCYGFECSLLLMDNNDKILTRFILVDTNEVWKISNRVKLLSYAPAPIPATYTRRVSNRNGNVIDPNVSMQQFVPGAQEGETPFAYINRNQEKLLPSLKDLFAIIDKKINSW